MKKDRTSYELTILSPADMNADDINDQISSLIRALDGEITQVEYSGINKLAYPVMKQEKAHYHFYNILLDDRHSNRLAGRLNIKLNILRYLLVRESTTP